MTLLRYAVAVALLVLAGAIVVERVDHGAAVPIAALIVVGALLLVITPEQLVRLAERTTKVSIGPFALELLKDADAAATHAEGAKVALRHSASGQDDEAPAERLVDLRLKLERKLAYIAKHMLGARGRPTFVTVGSLNWDGYLTDSEARTASRILVLSESDLVGLDAETRDAFLSDANRLVKNLRARVFFAQVRREADRRGCHVSEIPTGRARPDLLIERGDTRYRVVPLFATRASSPVVHRAIERLHELGAPAPRVSQTLIVVPRRSRAAWSRGRHPGLALVSFDDLDEYLGRPDDADDEDA